MSTAATVHFLDDDEIVVKRAHVRFPIELRVDGFRAEDLATWPRADGRLEYVDGRLLYMPPCADVQQYVTVDAVYVLRTWSAAHPEFVVGGNEAGMKLGKDVRAADVAVWRRADVGAVSGRVQHVAPILAIEVAGTDEEEPALLEKASWYLKHGVSAVWLVLPDTKEVVLVRSGSESRFAEGEQLPEMSELPGLCPEIAAFFAQLRGSQS